jgi:hypothetical protein
MYTRSVVINHLQTKFKGENVAIMFIYYNYHEQDIQTVSNLLASLLKQLVQECSVPSENVKSFHKRYHGEATLPTLDGYTKALELEIALYSKVFIIVDGLDEYPEDHKTQASLLKAVRSLSRDVNLMVTSRDLPHIASHFEGSKRLDIRASDQDLCNYIKRRITTSSPHLVASEKRIAAEIVKNSGSM